jgi:hypothetical protein
MEKWKLSKKGYPDEVKHIGAQLKGITNPVLEIMIANNMIRGSDVSLVRNFRTGNGSIQDFNTLFSSPVIRRFALRYFSSYHVIKEILISSKSCLRSKLIVLRHLTTLRRITHFPLKRWTTINKE